MVREVIEPAIQEPYELVDIEYGKMGGDYVLSVFVDKRGDYGQWYSRFDWYYQSSVGLYQARSFSWPVFSGSDLAQAYERPLRPRKL